MTAIGHRLGLVTLLVLASAPFAAAQQEGAGSSAPLPPLPGGATSDAEILRRLTAQLGGGSQLPFSPELLQAAQQMFGNGKIPPELLKDPKILKMAQDQIAKMSPEQLDQLKKQVQNPKPPTGLPPEVPRPGQPLPGDPPRPRPFDPPGGLRPPTDPPFVGPQPLPLPEPAFRPPAPGLPNNPSARQAIEFWEKNVGSLNEMPAVRDALVALATSGTDLSGNGKPFWEDVFKDVSADVAPSSSAGGFLKWLDLNTSGLSLSPGAGAAWTPPGSSWGGGSGGGFGPPSADGLGAVGIVSLALVGAAAVGLFVWKVLPVIREGRSPRPLPGQGPWPVDPRAIRTRGQLVAAFEYLSVLECGDRARTWNHVTIADGLRAAVPGSAAYADALARLYAVARYTPESEPLSDAAVAEAREHLCRVAGVSPA